MSPTKRRGPAWQPPTDDRLTVLRRQIFEAASAGQILVDEPLDVGRWTAWEREALELLEIALGPDHWPDEFERTTGGGGFAIVDPDYSSEAEIEQEQLNSRNEEVRAKLGVIAGALRAIDREVERRGVTPREGGTPRLPTTDFSWIGSARLRRIAVRDYAELAKVLGIAGTTKSRVVLAGAVVEALILDALASDGGEPPADALTLPLGALFERARHAGVISSKAGLSVPAVKDFRNMGHPGVELREGDLHETDAEQAVALLKGILAERSAGHQ